MNDKEIAQHFHDAFTEVTAGLSREMQGMAAPEEIVRGMMMGSLSFAAATWAASTKASGVDHALTKMKMTNALIDFYKQSIIPQTMRA